jgi:cation-transporting ATPase 13A3/4/5
LGSSSRHSRRSDAESDYALDAEEDEDERWGYSSGEEEEEEDIQQDNISISGSMAYDSDPPSPHASSLPLLSTDPIFGDEARIDMDAPLEDLDPPPPGPPSRQAIYVADEDSTIRFIGFETIPRREFLWRAGCVLTLGILGLLGHWFPRLWLRWVAREKAFKNVKHGFVVVEVGYSFALRCSSCL